MPHLGKAVQNPRVACSRKTETGVGKANLIEECSSLARRIEESHQAVGDLFTGTVREEISTCEYDHIVTVITRAYTSRSGCRERRRS
jgi:hypothetical protein